MRLSLNILARAPEPGQTKTRLIPALGAVGAAEAHKRVLAHVVGVAQGWSGEQRLVRLWCTPACDHPFLAGLVAPDALRTQPAGDLGQRMAFIARQGLQEASGVLLVGGDAGSLSAALLEEASQALRVRPAVLAPALDGGYVLLGLTRFSERLFEGIPWGSGWVAGMTRQRLGELGWAWHEQPGQWDVDTLEDWQRFVRQEPPS